ncbi:CLUMA_CG008090, isoform A [Clunio marinus]|uniref:CLUMA_CG008090, isoform A n=1 Tax=Clunio marinus TaxID=568069 RepID=A0A1J1I2Q5_9DIPT|nr:CLUMA_CG008090, isoform A [Clunio marinus]
MHTANGSMCSNDGKDSFWNSNQSSPNLSSSQYNNLNSLWGCSPIKNDAHEESLGSIWNIPSTSSPILKTADGTLEAPLPPPISFSHKSQPQLLRPQDIGGSVWNGMANNNNNNNNAINNSNNNNINSSKVKDQVGSLWAHPTPPNLPLTLQAQNYNLPSINSKFQSPIKPMGVAPPNGLCNGYPNQQQQMGAQQLSQGSTSCNMQLFSDEFLTYLNMIN